VVALPYHAAAERDLVVVAFARRGGTLGIVRMPRLAPEADSAADSSSVRGHNVALVLEDVRTHEPTSRAAVAARTGLARASLTTIVPELIAAGLLRDSSAALGSRGGRPVSPIEFDGSGFGVIAVEVTVSDIAVESVDLAGRTLRADSRAHGRPLADPESIVAVATRLIRRHLDFLANTSVHFELAVIVMPAPLIGSPPIVMASSDLGWRTVDLVGLIVAEVPELEGRALLVNDANVAVIAESRALAADLGAPATDLVYLKSLTGIGGAVISGGRLIGGANGVGFEPGHVLVRPGGRSCVCGRNGCFFAEAGPEAVLETAGLGELAASAGVAVAVSELVNRAHAGDPKALQALRNVGEILQAVIVDLRLMFDPQCVVLGGYWADVFDDFRIRDDLGLADSHTLKVAWSEIDAGRISPFVVPGRLGARAARAGAIRFAIDMLLAEPLSFGR
jgi:predicted NBD/HSP70 family sugar kinase